MVGTGVLPFAGFLAAFGSDACSSDSTALDCTSSGQTSVTALGIIGGILGLSALLVSRQVSDAWKRRVLVAALTSQALAFCVIVFIARKVS